MYRDILTIWQPDHDGMMRELATSWGAPGTTPGENKKLQMRILPRTFPMVAPWSSFIPLASTSFILLQCAASQDEAHYFHRQDTRVWHTLQELNVKLKTNNNLKITIVSKPAKRAWGAFPSIWAMVVNVIHSRRNRCGEILHSSMPVN